MSVLVDLIGDQLVDKDGQTSAVSDLTGRLGVNGIVGFYFSAHWCPPCKMFTPELASFYQKFRESGKGKELEIIFVSSDQDEDGFKKYLREMPWKALPFSDKERKAKLSKKYKVQGIPTLVFIEAGNGKLVTSKGRESIGTDPEGNEFPWYPKPFSEIIKGELLRGEDKVQSDESLAGKVKGFYFSAHWCPPCKIFTPELAETYEKLKTDGKNFEVVFVSSDRSLESFLEYYKTMPWIALPFQDKRIDQLSSFFDVEGIPCLVILDENNEIITNRGRAAISGDKAGKSFPWHVPAVEEIIMDNASCINEAACLVLFTYGDSTLISAASDLMIEIAKSYKAEAKAKLNTDNELPVLCFFYEGTESSEIASSIRSFTNLEGEEPVLALIDIPEERTYSLPAKNLTKEAVKKVVDDFKNGKLQFVPLRDSTTATATE